MPGFPFPGRPGGEHVEPLLDMIIARRALPPDAPAEKHDLARMLAALAGPGEPGELAGEVAARAAFIQVTSPAGSSPGRRRPVRHRKSRPAGRLTPVAPGHRPTPAENFLVNFLETSKTLLIQENFFGLFRLPTKSFRIVIFFMLYSFMKLELGMCTYTIQFLPFYPISLKA